MTIDNTDIQIISILLEKPRTSFNEIAKKCKMSTNAIRMRFQRLKETGVITGSIMQINPTTIGYECNGHIFIQTDYNDKDLFSYLEKIPNILRVHRQIGRFNVVAFFSLKSYNDLDDLVREINLHPSIVKTEVAIWVDVVKMDHPENLSFDSRGIQPKKIKNENSTQRNSGDNKSPLKLDSYDFSILNLLSKDARLSFNKISNKIGLSTQRVIERYEKMKKKVISFSSITVDLKKLGYDGIVIFRILVSNQATTSSVFEKLLEIPNVIIAYRTLGNFQILVGVPFSDIDHLEGTYKKITEVAGVVEIDVSLHNAFPSWPLNLFHKLVST